MKTALLDLIASKKFLAALTAVIVYIAGRFGFDVDTVTLDRVYFALLAFVGAQAIADNGKEAAKIYTAGAAPLATPAASQRADPQPTTGAASAVVTLGVAPRGDGRP